MAGRDTRSLIRLVLAWGLAAMWLYAALPKLLHPPVLLAAVKTYQLLPHPAEVALALWMPWLELGTAGALLLPRARRAGFLVTAALMAVFLAAILQAWWRGLEIRCGCFGGAAVTGGADYLWLVVRDMLLLAVGVWGLRGDYSVELECAQKVQ